MKKQDLYKHILFFAAMFAALFAFFQIKCEWHFFFIEQNQLFLNEWSYAGERMMRIGGVALALSEFLTQFFIYPHIGQVIVTLLLVTAGFLNVFMLRKILPAPYSLSLSLFPVIALALIHIDFNYVVWGTVAYIFSMAAFCFAINSTGRFFSRLGIHAGMIVLLFFIAGASYILYCALALVYEVFQPEKKRYLSLLLPLLAIIFGWIALHGAMVGEWRLILLPDGYYHSSLQPPSIIYYSHGMTLVLLFLALVLRNRKASRRQWIKWFNLSVIYVLAAVFYLFGIKKWGSDYAHLIVKELDYYSRTEQWDKILERCQGKLTNYLFLNYANLALIQKGQIGDKLFSVDQHDVLGMISNWDKTFAVLVLHSDVYFAMDLVAASQEMAFEASISSVGNGNPRMMKRLIQTNLILGAYPVAEKYIDVLEKTFAYRSWAKEMRPFLNNDEALEKDPLLGAKRRALSKGNSLMFIYGFDAELLSNADESESARTLLTCAGAWYLLAKDVGNFKKFVTKYYGHPSMKKLPVNFQEAVILLDETNPEYWKQYKVSESVISRFLEFKKQVVLASRNGNEKSLPGLLKPSFGNTYWYYFLFKEI
jgi:hypothetical protein